LHQRRATLLVGIDQTFNLVEQLRTAIALCVTEDEGGGGLGLWQHVSRNAA